MTMNTSINDLQKQVQPIGRWARKYAAFIYVLIILGVYVFLVQYIGGLIQDEPGQAAIDSKLTPVNRLKIDQDALQQITELESQNIEVKTLFDQARQNPFTE